MLKEIRNYLKRGIVGASLALALSGCAGGLEKRVADPLPIEPSGIMIDETDIISTDNPQKDDNNLAGLITAGIGMGLADYFLQTTIHEGSHIVMVKSAGGEITKFKPYPHLNEDNDLKFGSMQHNTDDLNGNKRALINIAPKMTDFFMLYTYAALRETHSLPENKYAQLAIWVVALGAEVDFVKDICSGICYDNPNNDLVQFEKNLHLNDAERAAVRGSILIISALAGYELYRGIEDIFNPNKESIKENSYGELTVGIGTVGYQLKF